MKTGFTRLRKRVGRAVRRRQSGVVVLMYHRIAEVTADPHGLAVGPREFVEQMEVLARTGPVIPLARLARALGTNEFPRRAFVITFDDGYRDNLIVAKPALERHGFPATVFVTSCAIGAQEEMWWDHLEFAVLQSDAVPDRLELALAGESRSFDFSTARTYSQDERRRDRNVPAWESAAGSRPHLYDALCREIQPLEPAQQRDVARRICDWAGVVPTVRTSSEMMTREEVANLAEGGLVDVGGHTTTHLQLSRHAPDRQQQREMLENKRLLREVTGREIVSFAYPYGDYDANGPRLVRESGFEQAVSTVELTARKNADPFEIPRFAVPCLGGAEFERWLRGCFAF